MWVLCLVAGCLTGCASGDGDAVATETRQLEYDFWTDIAKKAVETSVTLLNKQAGRSQGRPEMIVLTSAGCAMIDAHSTEACLDGLRNSAAVSEGKRTLLGVHAAGSAPLWFFVLETANGNGVYSEVDAESLNLTQYTISGELFAIQNLHNVKAADLFANLESANQNIFDAKAFNGNEFRIIGIANLIMEDAPHDLISAVQYHDHYCPGVTSGYFLVRYLETHMPLNDTFSSYFILSIPPWCKDDALITLLNATPGKGGYGVFHLNANDTASLREDARNIAGVFFRWNGSSTAPDGEGTVLAFDFAEAKSACNWGESTPWNWWESRLKMDLWYLDYLDSPERFITAIPVFDKTVFSLKSLGLISKPTDLARPGINPLEILGLNQGLGTGDFSTWRALGQRAAEEGLSMMKAQNITAATSNLITMTNAGYAEIDGKTTQGCLDGLADVTGASRGRNRLLEVHSHSEKPLYFAIYDAQSGLCAYLEVNSSFAASSTPLEEMNATDLFSIMNTENIKAEYLYAHAAESGARFNEKIFGGNEFAVVTILNAVDAGAPAYAVRAFEFHDHYCPGVTSGIMMAQYIKQLFPLESPSDTYFVQGVQPWCKEDALMVMLNATPGKTGYAVTYPTDADKARWLPEAQNAVNIIYRKNGSTNRWDGMVLGFTWGNTGCPSYGNSVIDKLCMDMWYLDRMDAPENFVSVIHTFELPEGVEPKAYARPGVDPMAMLGLTVSE